MALTSSETQPVGSPIPDFNLPNVVNGGHHTPANFADACALVVIFLCRHCPYVVHILPKLLEIANSYIPKNVAFVGICANDADEYPDDAPHKLREMALEMNIPFPILHDASQSIARAFHAVCTPEFYVYDGNHKLFYHGRMDASTPGNNIPCTGDDLNAALDALLSAAPAPAPQHPGMGCNIKWKK